jgi:hypothetical protein
VLPTGAFELVPAEDVFVVAVVRQAQPPEQRLVETGNLDTDLRKPAPSDSHEAQDYDEEAAEGAEGLATRELQ